MRYFFTKNKNTQNFLIENDKLNKYIFIFIFLFLFLYLYFFIFFCKMETKINQIETKIDQLETKIDQIYEMIKQMHLELKKPKNQNKDQDLENWWSIENNFNNVLIKFSKGSDFNEFKEYIKELGGAWFVSKKAWKFPIVSTDQIIESIKNKFPTKEFKDIRN